jgi:hypothetical protein
MKSITEENWPAEPIRPILATDATDRKQPAMPNIPLEDPVELRQLAAWYRDYSERASTPWVCEGRLQTAEELERYATLLEASGDTG